MPAAAVIVDPVPTAVEVVAGPAVPLLPRGVGEVLALAVAPDDGSAALAVPDRARTVVALAGLGLDVERRLARRRANGTAGEIVTADLDDDSLEQVLLFGVGAADPASLRRAGAAVGRACRGRSLATVVLPRRVRPDGVRAFTEGLLLAGPRFRMVPDRRGAPLERARLVVTAGAVPSAAEAVVLGAAGARATLVARALAATPSSVKTPDWLARQAVRLGRRNGVQVHVRDERALRAEGFGGLLAVGGGSASPPRLVSMRYVPSGLSAAAAGRLPHVVLVGKGITFDTGGLSLKPREAMVPMKTDMSGAGAVIAVMAALVGLGVGVRVTGVLAIAENMPGAAAYRPGDVITHWGGRTSEVVNTDAEGRLVLADALAWAAATLDPDVLVDVATLTGAATAALGRTHGALFATEDSLARDLERAGEASGERLWRLPLHDDYAFALASSVADSVHIGTGGKVGAGAITAALFLRPFTGGRPWAHLDIAGPGRSERERDDVGKGGTGFGARVLLRWLQDYR